MRKKQNDGNNHNTESRTRIVKRGSTGNNSTSTATRPNNGTGGTVAGNNGTSQRNDRTVTESIAVATIGDTRPSHTAISTESTDRTGTGDRIGDRDNSTTGTGTASRTGTNGNNERNIPTQNGKLDVELAPEPTPKLKRKYTKRNKAATLDSSNDLVRLAILTAINTTTNTIFNTVAIFAKDSKWKLQDDESLQLATDLDAALALLPDSQYEVVIKYLSTISPLASLATTLTGIVKKRLDTKSTTNTNSGKSETINSVVGQQQQTDFAGNWRIDPRNAITGANH